MLNNPHPLSKRLKPFQVFLLLIFFLHSPLGRAQFLSHLNAGSNDALFTTYAAPPERSHYKTDQGYQFQWTDNEAGVEFISRDGPNLGIVFMMEGKTRFRPGELYREPVVTISYSDLMKYECHPFPEIKVEIFFAVYSSETAIIQYRIVNEGKFPKSITVLPYLYYPAPDSINRFDHNLIPNGYTFPLDKQRDGWMVGHNIPVCEHFTGYYLSDIGFDSVHTFSVPVSGKNEIYGKGPVSDLKRSLAGLKRQAPYVNGIAGWRVFRMQPGDATSFRVQVSLDERGKINRDAENKKLLQMDPERMVNEDEKVYARIPKLEITNNDNALLYWGAFSLMRQCMMPPEGECRYNYYVFSREPRWGWGYGGQVFHESLAMMAYAYMDPFGAMNSQRVYMERQQDDGYINYRTGPYLNERIETGGEPTSSAPWYNYENLEIYKITRDRKFLREAYESGKKFYQYYVSKRDSNQNGLCEWGAHAELESVRDARVAVWDKVGWASNFEGPDLNSMLVREAKSLAEMAKILGEESAWNQWTHEANQRSEKINLNLWDTVTSFYYNINKKDQSFSFHRPGDLKIKEIIGFLPLWAGIPDQEKASALVEKMLDTTEFWRPYGVPSLSAGSDYYCPIGYWNGPVWVQWEYLIYRGLKDYGYDTIANNLANKVLDNMVYHLKNDHVFWEFYSADDRQAGWNNTYIWAGIAVRFFTDEAGVEKYPENF